MAAILADYRMPHMNGIDFLEQAMDLVPRARRALLTAYADTDAAIQAINVVDVDQYLLKPWEPPEEKFYPVIDELIAAWRSSGDSPVPETKVVGHHWSQPSYEIRDFLARSSVPYRWYAADEPAGQRLLAAAEADENDVPVVSRPAARSCGARASPRWPRPSGCPPTRPVTSTTSSSSAAARPGSGRRCTPHPRAFERSSSIARRPAGRPARAAGSRTTSASPTGSPVAS